MGRKRNCGDYDRSRSNRLPRRRRFPLAMHGWRGVWVLPFMIVLSLSVGHLLDIEMTRGQMASMGVIYGLLACGILNLFRLFYTRTS